MLSHAAEMMMDTISPSPAPPAATPSKPAARKRRRRWPWILADTGAAGATDSARRKRRRRWPWILAVLLLVGIAAAYLNGKKEKPITVTTERAVRKTIIQLVSATGKVQPETEVKISPEVAGEIIELPVIDGQIVRKGDLLIKIKPDNYQAQVSQQEAAISSAKSMSLLSKANVLKSEQDLRRAKELFGKKITSDTDLLTAQTNADVAKATYESSTYDIQRAESLLKQSRDLLEKTSVYSPIDGIISLLSVKLGERVVATGQFAGTEVMRVADLEHMEVRVNVNENDVVNVKLGDEAGIAVDAYPGRTFRGKVYQIANTAVTTGANTQEEVTNFEVRIRVPAQGASLRPGMSATADVETAFARDAVAVPIQAVTKRNLDDKFSPEERDKQKEKIAAAEKAGDDNSVELEKGKAATDREKAEKRKLQSVVFVKEGDTVHMRAVETGIADNSSLEVKSGVKPGEEIVSGSYRAISRLLKDGAKVMLEKAGS